MGNCCEHSKLTTDNEAENLIRETITNTKIYYLGIDDIKQLTHDEIGICIFDIPSDYKKWITENAYYSLINDFIHDDENQRLLLLDFEYTDFYSSLLMWILAFVSNNDDTKTEIVKEIIIKSDIFLSNGSFKKFLSNYLDIVLRRITENFLRCQDIYKFRNDYDELVNHIYREDNISNYCDKVYRRFLSLSKKNDDPNEIVKIETLRKFFKTYKILNIINVRDDFYMNYVIKKMN